MSRERLEPAHTGFAEALGVGHDVSLRDRNEIRGPEELTNLELMRERNAQHVTLLAGEHRFLFVI